jgi:biopolymer transport protein ExbD
MMDKQGDNVSLLIKIDQHVPYQSVAVALDVASSLGLTNISLETLKP